MNGNGQQSNSRLTSPPTPIAPPRGGGLFVPQRFAEAAQRATERSLQINIDSEDDAKSVIQNLPAIKEAYTAADVTSVEFCIAVSIAKKVELTLIGAIPWCRTYIKHIAPQPGNVLFPLPSYRDLSVPAAQEAGPSQTPQPESTTPVPVASQAHVKPQRPVRADSAKT